MPATNKKNAPTIAGYTLFLPLISKLITRVIVRTKIIDDTIIFIYYLFCERIFFYI